MEKTHEPHPPTGLARLAFRAPIWLYSAGLGSLLGNRFLKLTHTGRKSGLTRQTVLEVVYHQADTNIYYIASGYGEKSDWYRNLIKAPDVVVQVGRRSWSAIAKRLPPEEAEAVIMEYAQRHPAALKQLANFMGYHIEANEEDYRALGRKVPIFSLTPK